MKTIRVLVVMLAVVAGLMAGPVFADHDTPGAVAATVTPGLVSVSVTEAAVGYGVVNLSSGSLSTAEPSGQTCSAGTSIISASNTGNINAEFNLRGEDSFQVTTGAITGFSGINGSSPTTVTATGLPVGLTDNELVDISGTTNYDGILVPHAQVEVEAVTLARVVTATEIKVTETSAKAESDKAPKADAQELEITSGTPLVITLTGSDKETCDLDFTIVDGPAIGSLRVVSDAGCVAGHPTNTDSATLTYTPNDGFTGEDSFTFLVNDGQEDSEPAAVSITVEANSVEPAAVPPPTNKAPKADAQELETAGGTPLVITLTASDKETCDLAFTIVDGPANGALSVVSEAGCVAGDPINTDSAKLTYTPNDGFTGEDSFTFLVNDGQEDNKPAAVSITVIDQEGEAAAVPPPTNKAPKADAQELETASGTPLVITLTGSDKETCDLDFTIVDGPANGALSVVSDAGCVAGDPINTDSATLTYTPNDGSPEKIASPSWSMTARRIANPRR